MENLIFKVANKLWPDLDTASPQRRIVGTGEVITFLYSAPLALVGLVWLVTATDFHLLDTQWPMAILLAVLMFLFRKLGFFFITEIRAGRFASSDGSMESMVLWIGLFLFGPVALWLAVFWSTVDLFLNWSKLTNNFDRWSRLRNYTFYHATTVLAPLIALAVYSLLGGEIPLRNLSPQTILLAFYAILMQILLVLLIWLGFIAYAVWAQLILSQTRSIQPLLRFLFLAIGLPQLAQPFAILGAGLYAEHGFVTFIIFMVGLLLVAGLTRQLSWVAESNRQRARQLEKLEGLSHALLNASPNAAALPGILQNHVPSMFPSGRSAVWMKDQGTLCVYPDDWKIQVDPVWNWLKDQKGVVAIGATEQLPWEEKLIPHNAIVLAPILSVESNQPIGGVYVELHSLSQPWDMHSLASLFPAVLSLAAQVASALHQAEIYSQALAYQNVTQELTLAGKIQASFLPDELPRLDGYQLAVTLLPARETSGDFFDLIPLSDGRLGLLIADVTDKGVGAALYMALSRTLIRTYAIEFDDEPHPDVVFFAANGRILKDARANLFVTAFYGILDLNTGSLIYSNAGHNPPYLLRTDQETGEQVISPLIPTGMPVGIEEDSVWGQETVRLNPGDTLVLYTDGIPDSQNSDGEFFQDSLLIETLMSSQGLTASEIQDSILTKVQDFVGEAPQFDDITLMVLGRDEIPVPTSEEEKSLIENGSENEITPAPEDTVTEARLCTDE